MHQTILYLYSNAQLVLYLFYLLDINMLISNILIRRTPRIFTWLAVGLSTLALLVSTLLANP